MYEYDSRVRFSEVGRDGRMTLNAVLNYFQDCSTFQSEELGAGIAPLAARKRMWVLSSWQIAVHRYPGLGEHIKVCTWPSAFKLVTGSRNFCMLDDQGRRVACADSLWVFMDTERLRPARLDEEISSLYTLEPALDMGNDSGHILLPEGLKPCEAFRVQPYQLDVNRHVNNGQYVQMACAYLPENFEIRQMRAEYKKSALLGDVIHPWVCGCADGYTVVLENAEGKAYAVIEFKG